MMEDRDNYAVIGLTHYDAMRDDTAYWRNLAEQKSEFAETVTAEATQYKLLSEQQAVEIEGLRAENTRLREALVLVDSASDIEEAPDATESD